jgi:hypothetical protein
MYDQYSFPRSIVLRSMFAMLVKLIHALFSTRFSALTNDYDHS